MCFEEDHRDIREGSNNRGNLEVVGFSNNRGMAGSRRGLEERGSVRRDMEGHLANMEAGVDFNNRGSMEGRKVDMGEAVDFSSRDSSGGHPPVTEGIHNNSSYRDNSDRRLDLGGRLLADTGDSHLARAGIPLGFSE
jgi:hypothetical protein